jgi:CDP-diacylglycerol--glycerol-3-phosphate 3-phosphatidyltransferase
MTSADKLTLSRIILSPVFFAVYSIPAIPKLPAVVILWLLFAAIEVSDLLDGAVARSTKSVSGFGKLFDPFADVIARMTYFVCFAFSGIMPLWAFLVILYREFGMLFLRMLLVDKGITMGARQGGKAKAVLYMLSGMLSLALFSLDILGWLPRFIPAFRMLVSISYIVAVVLSLASFVDYLIQFKRLNASIS